MRRAVSCRRRGDTPRFQKLRREGLDFTAEQAEFIRAALR
jgi:hypothetical protein